MTAFDPRQMENPLTEGERAVRDSFIQEYLKDHDPYRACIRMGFLANFAIDHAKIFMADGYVLRGIAYLTRKASVESSDEDFADALENLRWLMHNGTPSSRATATKTYLEVKGYLKKDDDGEGRVTAIVDALKDFANNAPR